MEDKEMEAKLISEIEEISSRESEKHRWKENLRKSGSS